MEVIEVFKEDLKEDSQIQECDLSLKVFPCLLGQSFSRNLKRAHSSMLIRDVAKHHKGKKEPPKGQSPWTRGPTHRRGA